MIGALKSSIAIHINFQFSSGIPISDKPLHKKNFLVVFGENYLPISISDKPLYKKLHDIFGEILLVYISDKPFEK